MTSNDARGSPKVSIGLPVYNGEPYINGAIESLLGQDYSNLELIISDNASTDGTFDVCRAYADRDTRIRLHRNDTNMGAAANFNRVFGLATGPYFTWAAHDDLVHSTYVSKCVSALEDNPDIVLCSTDITFIDRSGAIIDYPRQYCRLDTGGMSLRERVMSLTSATGWFSLYGIMRASALRKTRLVTPEYGFDVLLLMELLFQGQTRVLPARLFSYRYIPKQTERYITDITGSAEDAPKTPYTGLAQALLRLIENSDAAIDLKVAMRNDLLDNVTHSNWRWMKLILEENPHIGRLPRHIQPIEARRVLYDGFSTSDLAKLRRRAYATHLLWLPAEWVALHWHTMRLACSQFMMEAARVNYWADYGRDVGHTQRAVWYIHNLLQIPGRETFRKNLGEMTRLRRASMHLDRRNEG